MDYYSMSEEGLLKEVGARIRDERLSSNMSQVTLAERAGVSITVVQNVEYGQSISLKYLLRLLRALNALEHLDGFLPKVLFNPEEIAKLEGKKRQRASKRERRK